MAKKNWMKTLFHNPLFIIGAVGTIGTAIVTLAGYITLPRRVEAVEEKTNQIEDYIKEQQIANELFKQYVVKEEEKIISPDGKYYFDNELGDWKPLKKK